MSNILATTLNGSYCLGASFIVLYGSFKCIPSSQTLSPSLNSLYFVSFINCCCACSSICCMAIRCSFICSSLFVILGTDVALLGWWMFGVYPRINSLGVFLVMLDGQEFHTYWARGSHSAHVC